MLGIWEGGGNNRPRGGSGIFYHLCRMLRIGSQTEYSARIMIRLAAQAEAAPLCAQRIAALERIPRDYVDQLLMRLRRAGLVRSLRGVRGGYVLARPMREVSVGNVIRAVEARVFEPVCSRYTARPGRCPRPDGCGMRPVWEKLGRLVEGYLDGVSLDELAPAAGPRPSGGGERAP